MGFQGPPPPPNGMGGRGFLSSPKGVGLEWKPPV